MGIVMMKKDLDSASVRRAVSALELFGSAPMISRSKIRIFSNAAVAVANMEKHFGRIDIVMANGQQPTIVDGHKMIIVLLHMI